MITSEESELILGLLLAIVALSAGVIAVSSATSNIPGVGFCYDTQSNGNHLAVTPPENGSIGTLMGGGGGRVTRLTSKVEYVVSLRDGGESEVYTFWDDSEELSISTSGNRTFVALAKNGTTLDRVQVVQTRCERGESE